MELELLEDGEQAWAKQFSWEVNGEGFELLIPQARSPQVMLLPSWGWARVKYCYRVRSVSHEEPWPIYSVADVFQGPGERVLVVQTHSGREPLDEDGDDFIDATNTRVWEAPARVAEPPLHLVKQGGHRQLDAWLLSSLAPPAAVTFVTRAMGYERRLTRVTPVEFDQLSDWLREAADKKRAWASMVCFMPENSLAALPKMVVHYEGASGRPTGWALAYPGEHAGVDFALVVIIERSSGQLTSERAHIVWNDTIQRLTQAHGEQEGWRRVLAERMFDANTAMIDD